MSDGYYQDFDDNYWEWAYQLELEAKHYLSERENHDAHK